MVHVSCVCVCGMQCTLRINWKKDFKFNLVKYLSSSHKTFNEVWFSCFNLESSCWVAGDDDGGLVRVAQC